MKFEYEVKMIKALTEILEDYAFKQSKEELALDIVEAISKTEEINENGDEYSYDSDKKLVLINTFEILNNALDENDEVYEYYIFENIDEIMYQLQEKYRELIELTYENGIIVEFDEKEDKSNTDFIHSPSDLLKKSWQDIYELDDDLEISNGDLENGFYTVTQASRKKDRRLARDKGDLY